MSVRHVTWEEVADQPAHAIRFPMSGWWVIEAHGDRVAGPFDTHDAAAEYIADVGASK